MGLPKQRTSVKRSLFDTDVKKNDYIEDVYLIPTGKVCHIRNLDISIEYTTSDVHVQLIHRSGSDSETLLGTYYALGGVNKISKPYDIDCGNSGSIVMKAVNNSPHRIGIAVEWDGYITDK